MAKFRLTYPELKDLPEAKLAELISRQGWYSREILVRIEKGKLSKGDLERVGIKIRSTDIKRLLQYNQEFKNNPILIYKKEKGLMFEGKHQRFNILLEAIGIEYGKLKDGDIINLYEFKPKGKIPVLELEKNDNN